jgi:hypothetical protein
MPAPIGNANALTSGLKAVYTTSRFPKGCGYVERRIRGYKAALQAAVVEQHGEVSIYHASVIQSACRHESAAQLAERWFRLEENGGTLDMTARASLLSLICKSSDARDRCLKALDLDTPPDAGPLAGLDWGKIVEPPGEVDRIP